VILLIRFLITRTIGSVLQATVILTAATVVIFNAMTDIAYAIVDPRIRVK